MASENRYQVEGGEPEEAIHVKFLQNVALCQSCHEQKSSNQSNIKGQWDFKKKSQLTPI